MQVNGKQYRTIWVDEQDPKVVKIIDQRLLPHQFIVEELRTVADFAAAIKEMHVRGAGLIGATAGFGMYCAVLNDPGDDPDYMTLAAETLLATRPTAKNLAWAVARQQEAIGHESSPAAKQKRAFEVACQIADEDAEYCRRLGQHGLEIIREISKKKNGPVNILTHCNAGWLAFVDYGSATAPIYAARDAGIDVHVWVDETRPWLQGSRLTAWELGQEGIPHTLIPDNTGGHLMQHGMVDMVIVGTDRTTRCGDVANKIGTYLKALAAHDNNVPFYVALPSSTFDWEICDGVREIPIEQRSDDEIKFVNGQTANGDLATVRIAPEGTVGANYGFDVTPARLISGLITERGICKAAEADIMALYPEKQEN
jgi:methylthioribose-1-phosphate isomerase